MTELQTTEHRALIHDGYTYLLCCPHSVLHQFSFVVCPTSKNPQRKPMPALSSFQSRGSMIFSPLLPVIHSRQSFSCFRAHVYMTASSNYARKYTYLLRICISVFHHSIPSIFFQSSHQTNNVRSVLFSKNSVPQE
jgi:hypothetical protein